MSSVEQNQTEAASQTDDASSAEQVSARDVELKASDNSLAKESTADNTQPATEDVAKVETEANTQTADDSSLLNVENLQTQLADMVNAVAEYKDLALRAKAEMDNVRRRAARDVENVHKFGQEKLIENLLPLTDSLEKAIEAATQAVTAETNRAITEGVSLCLKMLLDVLDRQGVQVVDPIGEPFDPNLHQAMSMVENPDAEPNAVVAVVQKGYTLNERLVRPAMVMISKAPESKAQASQNDETA